MSKSITFGIAEFAAQRTSKTRVYTHAIVGFFDGAKMYNRQWELEEKQAREDHAYYCKQAAAGAGHSEESKRHNVEIAALTANQYVDRRLNALASRCAKLTGEGALQWSQSKENARKACGAWTKRHYENVRVVPCFPVKKTNGAPTISETPLTRGW